MFFQGLSAQNKFTELRGRSWNAMAAVTDRASVIWWEIVGNVVERRPKT